MTTYGRIYKPGMGYVDYCATVWWSLWSRLRLRRFRKNLDECILAAFGGDFPASIPIPKTLTYYRLEIELSITGVSYPAVVGLSRNGEECSYCITLGTLVCSGLLSAGDLRLLFRGCREIVAQAIEDEDHV